jgi:hypothetical protein
MAQNPKERQRKWYWAHVLEQRERTVNYRAANREVSRARSREYMRRARIEQPNRYRRWQIARYGISFDRYKELLELQDNKCAICRQPEGRKRKDGSLMDLSVDHCHITRHVRGLLCARCNSALAWYEQFAGNAEKYLMTGL